MPAIYRKTSLLRAEIWAETRIPFPPSAELAPVGGLNPSPDEVPEEEPEYVPKKTRRFQAPKVLEK